LPGVEVKEPEKWIDFYLQQFTIDHLEDAATKITNFFH
jgi:hypothetical protein